MPEPHPIGVALIGYGLAGKTFHAPLIKAAGMELLVFGSRDANKVHADFPAAKVVADPIVAATHPYAQLVVIASPNDSHVSLATAALQAGKHVVVDKPFTLTLAEARELAALAASKKLLLSVFQNRRWDSDFLGLQAVLAEGRLGEVWQFESNYNRYRMEILGRWREQEVPGNGLWYDLGPHLVDQALQLFGLPQSVNATLIRQRPGAVAVDWCHVLLNYGARRVILNISMVVSGGEPRFAVHGTGGSWIKYGLDTQEERLRAGAVPGEPGWGKDPQPAMFYPAGTPTPVQLPAPPGDYRHYYSRFRDAILKKAPNPVPPAQAIAVMAVLEAGLNSAATGQTVSLPLTESERANYLAGQ